MSHPITQHQQAVVAYFLADAKTMAVAGCGKATTLAHFIAARLTEGAECPIL